MHEHPIDWQGKEYAVVLQALSDNLSKEYQFEWQLYSDCVLELPSNNWLNGEQLTRQLLDERRSYLARQRSLMDAAISATEEALRNG
jgi:hypothetical protein